MEFYAHVDDDIMAQWAKSATEALDKRVTALEESLRPKTHADTIASQPETRWKEEAKYLKTMANSLEAVINGLRADIAQRNTLIESQAQTIKRQAQELVQIHEALQYKGDTPPQAHLNHVRRVAGVSGPTRRFR